MFKEKIGHESESNIYPSDLDELTFEIKSLQPFTICPMKAGRPINRILYELDGPKLKDLIDKKALVQSGTDSSFWIWKKYINGNRNPYKFHIKTEELPKVGEKVVVKKFNTEMEYEIISLNPFKIKFINLNVPNIRTSATASTKENTTTYKSVHTLKELIDGNILKKEGNVWRLNGITGYFTVDKAGADKHSLPKIGEKVTISTNALAKYFIVSLYPFAVKTKNNNLYKNALNNNVEDLIENGTLKRVGDEWNYQTNANNINWQHVIMPKIGEKLFFGENPVSYNINDFKIKTLNPLQIQNNNFTMEYENYNNNTTNTNTNIENIVIQEKLKFNQKLHGWVYIGPIFYWKYL